MESITTVLSGIISDLPDAKSGFTLEEITVELPLELQVHVDAAGPMAIEASAPRQRVATSIVPVFHRLHLRVEGREDR